MWEISNLAALVLAILAPFTLARGICGVGGDSAAIVFPNISLFKRGEQYIREYLHALKDKAFNFEYHGCTGVMPPIEHEDDKLPCPPGYWMNKRRVMIGKGEKTYKRAVQAMKDGEVVRRLGWAELILPKEKDVSRWEGLMLATHAFSYVVWSVNPCRIVLSHWDRRLPQGDIKSPEGTYSALAFATVEGHLLSGEERFCVEWRKNKVDGGEVWFDLMSFSRGHGILGAVAVPFVRPIQKRFFIDQCNAMLDICTSVQ